MSGSVARPGLYEVESGATLREVLELAGGTLGTLKAILLGGAAGGFVTPDDLDIRLTFEAARAGGYTLGSGVVMAFNESVAWWTSCCGSRGSSATNPADSASRVASGPSVRRRRSTGWRPGARSGAREQELALIDEIAQVMRDASICGLGQTAAAAVQSAVQRLHLFDPEGASA